MMKKSLPNWLTYSRILVIPLLIVAFYQDKDLGYWLSAGLFLYASITDYFDGYFARAWAATSKLGQFLDPIADKLLIVTALVLLVDAHRASIYPAIAIICREVLVSGLREFLACLKISMPVSKLAKIKTGLQMVAIFLLLLGPAGPYFMDTEQLGSFLLWAAALLTLVTGYAYLRTGLRHMED